MALCQTEARARIVTQENLNMNTKMTKYFDGSVLEQRLWLLDSILRQS